jgi:hypothetical protein
MTTYTITIHYIFPHAASLNALADNLESAATQLRAMEADGLTFREATEAGHYVFETTDPQVAAKWGIRAAKQETPAADALTQYAADAAKEQ